MKSVLWICLTLVSLKGCGQEFQEDLLEEVQYTVSSRGFYLQVTATPHLLSVQRERGEAQPKTLPMSAADWHAIAAEVQKVEPASLEHLQVDTDRSAVDRAAMAELLIRYDREEYLSQPFDHGYPPKALESLVNKMLGLAEPVERQ